MAGSLEEALALASGSNSQTPRYRFIIDNDLRTISLPSDLVFGVYFDRNVQTIDFEMPRYYHDLDLSTFGIRVNYIARDENREVVNRDIYPVRVSTHDDTKIYFEWTVNIGAYLENGGTVTFAVCLRELNSNDVVVKEFNTTIHTVSVLPGLEVEIDESDLPVIKDYLAQISAYAIEVYNDRIAVTNMKSEMEDEIDEATTNLTQIGTYYANLGYQYKQEASDSAITSKNYADDSKGYRDESKNYRDQAAAIVTPDGIATRVLALEDLGFTVDSDGYIVQEDNY